MEKWGCSPGEHRALAASGALLIFAFREVLPEQHVQVNHSIRSLMHLIKDCHMPFTGRYELESSRVTCSTRCPTVFIPQKDRHLALVANPSGVRSSLLKPEAHYFITPGRLVMSYVIGPPGLSLRALKLSHGILLKASES